MPDDFRYDVFLSHSAQDWSPQSRTTYHGDSSCFFLWPYTFAWGRGENPGHFCDIATPPALALNRGPRLLRFREGTGQPRGSVHIRSPVRHVGLRPPPQKFGWSVAISSELMRLDCQGPSRRRFRSWIETGAVLGDSSRFVRAGARSRTTRNPVLGFLFVFEDSGVDTSSACPLTSRATPRRAPPRPARYGFRGLPQTFDVGYSIVIGGTRVYRLSPQNAPSPTDQDGA